MRVVVSLTRLVWIDVGILAFLFLPFYDCLNLEDLMGHLVQLII